MKALTFYSFLLLGLFVVGCEAPVVDPILPTPTLSDQEATSLQFLHEEEKLARDVYRYALDLYPIPVFDHISSSEQNHMDAIKELLDKYALADLSLAEEGAFSNSDLQALYDDLIMQVDLSEVEALKVGATIEDLDISDIRNLRLTAESSDLLQVLDDLECGSGNHIRAFTSQLENHNETYVPQFLAQEAFDAILAAGHQSCGN